MGGLIFICGSIVTLLIAFAVCELFLPVENFHSYCGVRPHPAYTYAVIRRFDSGNQLRSHRVLWMITLRSSKNGTLGLTARQKMFAQLLVSLGYSLSVYMAGGSTMRVPFLGDVNLGFMVYPSKYVYHCCLCKRDQLDRWNRWTLRHSKLCCDFVFPRGSRSVELFWAKSGERAAFAGSLAGFLIWNLHPARVFMGDTGSLFIGGMLCVHLHLESDTLFCSYR